MTGKGGGDTIFGRNPVRALLLARGRQADEVAVLAGGRGPLVEITALARQAGVRIALRTREQLTAMAGSPDHQGVVARVAAQPYVDLEALLEAATAAPDPGLLLALDQLQDPRNLGAILRTADGFGVHGVVVPKHHQVGLTGAAARTAMGAAEAVPVCRVTNLARALDSIKRAGLWVYGAVPAGGVSVWQADFRGPVCLVLGGEGPGIRPLVRTACDVLVSIPLEGRVGSLNVGAAAAVLCAEVSRQRRGLDSGARSE